MKKNIKIIFCFSAIIAASQVSAGTYFLLLKNNNKSNIDDGGKAPFIDKRIPIAKIETKLQTILDQKTSVGWSVEDLQKEVQKSYKGIIVGLVEQKLYSSQIDKKHSTIFSFKGNGEIYINEIRLTHVWEDNSSIDIREIKDKLQKIVDSKEYEVWSAYDLQTEVQSQYEGVTVSESALLGSSIASNKTFTFAGNYENDNNLKYSGKMDLTQTWKANTTKNISEIKDKLQAIIDTRPYAAWSVPKLQEKVDEKFKGVIVSKKTTLGSYIENKNHFTFTGNGTVDNDLPYSGSIDLTQTWKTDTTIRISTIRGDLEEIVNSPDHIDNVWNARDLESIVRKKFNDKGITVTVSKHKGLGSYIKDENTFTFTGNGNTENHLKYKGSIDITQTWNKNTTKDINEIKDKLHEIVDRKKYDVWSASDLQAEVQKTYKGVTVSEKSNLGSWTQNQKTFTFTGNGSVSNDWEYYGSIDITQTWNKNTTKDINEIKDKLKEIVDGKKYDVWSASDLQTEVQKNPNYKGITVSEKQNLGSSDIHEKTFTFTGNGTVENDLQYSGSIDITQKWKTDTTKNISEINDKLQEIVDSKKYDVWSASDLQTTVQKNQIYKGITVSEKQNLGSSDSHEKTFTFTGNGTVDNDLPYSGSIDLTQTWKTDATIDISTEKAKIEKKINALENESWNTSYKSVSDNWVVNAMEDILENKAKGGFSATIKEINDYTETISIAGLGTIDNNHKYKGSITITHNWLSSKTLTKWMFDGINADKDQIGIWWWNDPTWGKTLNPGSPDKKLLYNFIKVHLGLDDVPYEKSGIVIEVSHCHWDEDASNAYFHYTITFKGVKTISDRVVTGDVWRY